MEFFDVKGRADYTLLEHILRCSDGVYPRVLVYYEIVRCSDGVYPRAYTTMLRWSGSTHLRARRALVQLHGLAQGELPRLPLLRDLLRRRRSALARGDTVILHFGCHGLPLTVTP